MSTLQMQLYLLTFYVTMLVQRELLFCFFFFLENFNETFQPKGRNIAACVCVCVHRSMYERQLCSKTILLTVLTFLGKQMRPGPQNFRILSLSFNSLFPPRYHMSFSSTYTLSKFETHPVGYCFLLEQLHSPHSNTRPDSAQSLIHFTHSLSPWQVPSVSFDMCLY